MPTSCTVLYSLFQFTPPAYDWILSLSLKYWNLLKSKSHCDWGYPFARRRSRRMRHTLEWRICNCRLARCVDCWELLTKVSRTRSTVSADGPGRPVCFATLLEFLVPLTNCFVFKWSCVVLVPKPPLHCHNWLSFGKLEDTERFLVSCPRHVSSRLLPSGVTCTYPWRLLSKGTWRDCLPIDILTDLLKASLDNGSVNTFQRATMEGMSQWTNVIPRC
jgi:hypothetical protein